MQHRILNLPLPFYNAPGEPAGGAPTVDPAVTVAAAAPAAGEPPKVPDPAARPPSIAAEPAIAEPKPGDPPKEPEKKDDLPTKIDPAALKIPEGFDAKSEDGKKGLDTFTTIMNDEKLSPQERSQKLVDFYAEEAKKGRDAATKQWFDLQDKWRGEITKELGDKLEPTKRTIGKAIDIMEPELAKGFREALDFTGAGNNPAIIKGIAAWAEKLVEGGHVPGGPGSGKSDAASVFFPNSPEFQPQKG